MTAESPTVLVVDDDEMMLDFAVEAINQIGHVAVGRVDATGALEFLKSAPTIQLLLSDVCLTAGTGPDLVRLALRDRPDLKVVFMTGGFSEVSFRRTDPILNKPFGLDLLRETIESVFSPTSSATGTQCAGVERRRTV